MSGVQTVSDGSRIVSMPPKSSGRQVKWSSIHFCGWKKQDRFLKNSRFYQWRHKSNHRDCTFDLLLLFALAFINKLWKDCMQDSYRCQKQFVVFTISYTKGMPSTDPGSEKQTLPVFTLKPPWDIRSSHASWTTQHAHWNDVSFSRHSSCSPL